MIEQQYIMLKTYIWSCIIYLPMYNLSGCSSKNSDTTGSLWFYYKDGATNFKADIADGNNFKSFSYKAKLLGNTIADGLNEILRDTTIAV